MCEEGGIKWNSFGTCLNLSGYQLKTICYLHSMSQVNFMETIRKKLTENTKNKMRTESTHNIKHKGREKEGTDKNYKNREETVTKWH